MATTATVIELEDIPLMQRRYVRCRFENDIGEVLHRQLLLAAGVDPQVLFDSQIPNIDAKFRQHSIEESENSSGTSTKDESRSYWWARIFDAMLENPVQDDEVLQTSLRMAGDTNAEVAVWVNWREEDVTAARVKLADYLDALAALDHGEGAV